MLARRDVCCLMFETCAHDGCSAFYLHVDMHFDDS